MKKGININFNIQKRHVWFLVGMIVMFGVVGFGIASVVNPNVHGHGNIWVDDTGGNVGIMGPLTILRTSLSEGPGEDFSLQSWSENNVAPIRSAWVPRGGLDVEDDCGSNDDEDPYNSEYVCKLREGGEECVDVALRGSSASNKRFEYSNLTCVADTDKYSLRTNEGTLEFKNTADDIKMSLSQDGDLEVTGDLIFPDGTIQTTAMPAFHSVYFCPVYTSNSCGASTCAQVSISPTCTWYAARSDWGCFGVQQTASCTYIGKVAA